MRFLTNIILLIFLGGIPIFATELAPLNSNLDNAALLSKLNQMNAQMLDLSNRLNEKDAIIQTLISNFTAQVENVNKKLDLQSLTSIPGDGWTVIQRRQDGSVDFYRFWSDYKQGFGNPNGEFFIGLEKLHALTTYGPPQQLLIVLQDFDNNTRYAKYDSFAIGNESEKYALKTLGKYSGDAEDSMRVHKGHKFTTQDQDNDDSPDSNCAKSLKGAWWYSNCYKSNLNGRYLRGLTSKTGISWNKWLSEKYSLKFVEMKIRPAPQIIEMEQEQTRTTTSSSTSAHKKKTSSSANRDSDIAQALNSIIGMLSSNSTKKFRN